MPDNNTNLPILDDIIKPGDADKAAHQPSNKVHSSLLSEDETNDPGTARIHAETNLHSAADDQPDSVELYSDNQPGSNATDRIRVSSATTLDDEYSIDDPVEQGALAEIEQVRPSAIDLPDIDALTEEILDNLILQIEPLLRDRIQQTLSRHLSGENKHD